MTNAEIKDIARAAVVLAAKHADNGSDLQSSAKLNLDRAVTALHDRPVDAIRSSIRSLEYSVGIFHEDLKRAWALGFKVDPKRYG